MYVHDIRRDILGLIQEYDDGLTVGRLRVEARSRFEIEGALLPYLSALVNDGLIEKFRDTETNQTVYRPVKRARK